MNAKGQAFDVFKLLIAAVVAAAILLMLLSILNQDIFNPNQDPNQIAIKAVKDLKNQRGSPQFLDNVTFKNGATLIASAIADKSDGLSTNQVCVLKSDKAANSTNFTNPTSSAQGKIAQGKIIKYIGSSAQKTRLLVMCDRMSDMSSGKIGYNNGSFSQLGFDTGDFALSTSSCWSGASDSTTVCLVAIVPEA